MTEAQVSKKLRDALNELPNTVCWKISDRFNASRPDLIICHAGEFLAIETKVHPNRLTPLQQLTLDTLRKAGADTYVATYHKGTKLLSLLHEEYGHQITFKDIKDAALWLLRPRS